LILADEARELKRMREIPENISIVDAPTISNEGTEDIIFDDQYNDEESSDDEGGQPGNRNDGNDSPSDDDSNEDEEDEYFSNPNRMPKKNPNLAKGKKETGKGARNNRREAISGSDSDVNDEIANI